MTEGQRKRDEERETEREAERISFEAQLKNIQADIATAKSEIIEAINNRFNELRKILTDTEW